MLKTLYQIQEDYATLTSELLENEGELSQEMEQALEITGEEFVEKAAAYALRIREFEGHIQTIDREISRLTDMAKRYTKARDFLKERICNAMLQFKTEKLKTDLVTLSLRKSKRVNITDEGLIPEEFYTEQAPVISTARIREALREGSIIPGAELIEHQSVQIK